MEFLSEGMDVPLWTILLTCALVLLYIDYMWTFSNFNKRGIPGPRPWPLVGNLVSFLTLGFCEADSQWRKKFGNVYGFYRGRVPFLVVHDMKMLESIMIKDFSSFHDRESSGFARNKPMHKGVFFLDGQEWKDVRNLMSPTFTSGKLKQMFGLINESGVQLGANFVDLAKQGTNAVVKELYGAYTMEVIASTAFGLKVDSQKDPDNVFIWHVKNIFKRKMNLAIIIFFFFPSLIKPVKNFVDGMWPQDSIQFFDGIIKEAVRQRRHENVKRVDFLQLLMDAETEDSVMDGDSTSDAGNPTTRATKKRLTIDEVVAQAFIFFIAGYETTATALQFLSYSLALNAECQEKAYQEIRDIIGDADPTYESVSRLTYLEQCLQEALRLHPPITGMSRVATRETKLGDYPIPKGSLIQLPFYGIHHNPEYYPDPEVFDPDRFSPESKATRHPILFTPFGNGPRICLGSRLAYLEAKVAMVHVLRKVRLHRCDETQVPLSFVPSGLLVTTKPITVGVELR